MPVAGFGTLKLGDMKQTKKAVEQALEATYKLFDTAQSYANEEGVGREARWAFHYLQAFSPLRKRGVGW